MKSNPQLAEQAMHAQWQNILSIIGYSILPKVIPLMVRFATGLDRIGQFMSAHPNRTSGLAIGLLGVGASLIVVGKALMTVGPIRFLGMGPILMSVASTMSGFIAVAFPWIAAIAGVAAAGYAAYKHWDQIKAGFTAAWNAIHNGAVAFINGIIGLANRLPFVHINPIGTETPRPNVIAPARPFHPGSGDILMDGKKVGRVIWPHVADNMGRAASRPNTSTSGFNPGMGPLRPTTAR